LEQQHVYFQIFNKHVLFLASPSPHFVFVQWLYLYLLSGCFVSV